VCGNCQLALAPEPTGIRIVPLAHAAGGAGSEPTWLPFWAFPFRLTITGGLSFDRLEAWAAALFPRGLPPGFSPGGTHLFVPAIRLLGSEIGDECFKSLAEAIHGAPPRVESGKVALGGRPRFEAATLGEDEAREVLPFVLYALHGSSSAAQLNTLLLKRMLDQAQLTPGPPQLVLLPFRAAEDGGILIPGTDARLPRLLLDGGPLLDAQQATVYQPRPPVAG
jgi:hypothetical protein